MLGHILLTLLLLVSLLLISLILVQRGQGGGLAGEFGAAAGGGALGAQSRMVFRAATVAIAVIWAALGCLADRVLGH